MSEQEQGTVFDRYKKRGFLPAREDERKPSAATPDTEHNTSQNQQAEREAAPRDVEPALEVFSNDAGDDVVQAGMYRAAFIYKAAKTRPRLRLHFADGIKVKVLAYAHLVEIIATSHQWLTLVFSSTIVTIKGRHLDALLESFQDERVRALICYRPGIHPQVASNEPCIVEIIEKGIHDLAGETQA